MTMLLSRCCFCFHLKYGYFAYGILSMAVRLMTCFSLYHASDIFFGVDAKGDNTDVKMVIMSQAMKFYFGWVATAVASLFLTLKGIVQKRSILIYPYIVVLCAELCGVIISCIILCMIETPYYLVVLPLGAVIVLYELWCLISLYKQIKCNERMPYMGEPVPFKAV